MSANSKPLTNPATGEALAPKVQPGYYPQWRVMKEQRYWDAATRDLVLKRMTPNKPVRFFNGQEAATMEAVLDRILPQDDREPQQRIPLLPVLDERLYTGRIEGFRYEEMPSDREAYRIAAAAFEAMAQELYQSSFSALTATSQELILKSIHDEAPLAAKDAWKGVSISRFWQLMVSDACSAYYAHPLAWNEVGYGGPAYPRGYMRLEEGEPEPWEFNEQRYEWAAPSDSISDTAEPLPGNEQTHQGQTGTH